MALNASSLQVSHAKTLVETNHDYKVLILFILSLLCLAFLYSARSHSLRIRKRPLGRRVSDKGRSHKMTLPHPFSVGITHSQNWTLLSLDCKKYTIFLFHRTRVKLIKCKKNYFLLSQNSVELDSLFSPVIRKVQKKFLNSFEREHPIQVFREEIKEPLFFIVPNELMLHKTVFGFLEESLNISQCLNVSPSLLFILAKDVLVVSIWKNNKNISNLFKDIHKTGDVIKVQFENFIGLGLCLAGTSQQVEKSTISLNHYLEASLPQLFVNKKGSTHTG